MKISDYANSLEIPDDIGGIHRTESPFIRSELNRREEELIKQQPSFNFGMLQS